MEERHQGADGEGKFKSERHVDEDSDHPQTEGKNRFFGKLQTDLGTDFLLLGGDNLPVREGAFDLLEDA